MLHKLLSQQSIQLSMYPRLCSSTRMLCDRKKVLSLLKPADMAFCETLQHVYTRKKALFYYIKVFKVKFEWWIYIVGHFKVYAACFPLNQSIKMV